ncbi:hypothetical protein [Paractinoplanes atraurantiacus]|uniref:Uncharacterized protein n=1 Tax=Paractinoplanes atraurantiacus TaxID=1036182 RepID=A0A285KB80_9ACTN|nr:hypothetical protein [Actinoplanes atraurantiacus]SNY69862.1 hypothetical protein SAMN05421748_13629 [Actinoplanes atraurantiacus]
MTVQPHLVERAGVTVVLGDAPAPPDELLAGLPGEPGFRPVVVAVHPGPSAEELARLLHGRVDGTRLILSYAAVNGIARTLADRLRVPVVAPTGAALMLPERLFVQHGEWVRFRPGAEPVGEGARFPAPRWQAALRHGPALTPIPAGLWLGPSGEAVPGDVLTLPVLDERVTVVVGPVPPPEARAALRTLPWPLRHEMLLEPYGTDPGTVKDIGRRITEGFLPTRTVTRPVPGAAPVAGPAADKALWRPAGAWRRTPS